MRNFFRNLMKALGQVFKFIWDPVSKTGHFVSEHAAPIASGVADLAAGVLGAVASIPAAMLSQFKQRVPPTPQGEQPIAKAAADNEVATDEQRAVEATRAALNASVDAATLVRRFASAAVDGRTTPSLAPLPDDVRLWLTNLSDAQLSVLAEADFAECQRHLSGSVPLAGVPVVGSPKARESEPTTTAEVVRPVFVKPTNGYARPTTGYDMASIAAEVAANRAERDRMFAMRPAAEIARELGLEVSNAYATPRPKPRAPMAMSSRR